MNTKIDSPGASIPTEQDILESGNVKNTPPFPTVEEDMKAQLEAQLANQPSSLSDDLQQQADSTLPGPATGQIADSIPPGPASAQIADSTLSDSATGPLADSTPPNPATGQIPTTTVDIDVQSQLEQQAASFQEFADQIKGDQVSDEDKAKIVGPGLEQMQQIMNEMMMKIKKNMMGI